MRIEYGQAKGNEFDLLPLPTPTKGSGSQSLVFDDQDPHATEHCKVLRVRMDGAAEMRCRQMWVLEQRRF
jgi:hypothetical protein